LTIVRVNTGIVHEEVETSAICDLVDLLGNADEFCVVLNICNMLTKQSKMKMKLKWSHHDFMIVMSWLMVDSPS
jgi:Ni/Fe-hydrogenase subunit HybB-like protein